MFFNCMKIVSPNNRPPAQKSNPIIRRARPSMPKCCTVDRSGNFRLASPPACSCALANVESSRHRMAATILYGRFKNVSAHSLMAPAIFVVPRSEPMTRLDKKATTSESVLTAIKKYTQYCAVTNPPKLKFWWFTTNGPGKGGENSPQKQSSEGY